MTTTLSKPIRSARKAKGDGHLRRAEILRAAERIFVAEGYEGATIRKIADEVGVSSTCLYMHFRDKDEILLEICRDVIGELLAVNSEIATLEIDPVQRVRLMLRAYIDLATRNPNAYRLVFCSTFSEAQAAKASVAESLGQECAERFKGVVREIAAQGRLRAADTQAVYQALWAGCHGLVSLMITKPTMDWAPPDRLAEVMVDGLLFGLIAD